MRVMIVDDHVLFAESLARLVSDRDDVADVVVMESVAALRGADPAVVEGIDVALVDWRLGDGSAPEAIGLIRRSSSEAKVLVVTGAVQPFVVSRSRELGCIGVLTKDQAASELWSALDGRDDRFVMAPAAEDVMGDRGDLLTTREMEVVRALARGSTNSEIADELFMSVNTVRNHIQRIAAKLGVRSRLDVVMTALRSGLIDMPDPDPESAPAVQGRTRPATREASSSTR